MESFIPVFSILMDIISSLHVTLTIFISEPISNIYKHLLGAGTITDIHFFNHKTHTQEMGEVEHRTLQTCFLINIPNRFYFLL
jgi:hypothetical protein